MSEFLFDPTPYEQETTTPEIKGPIELLPEREVLSICDQLHDEGYFQEALDIYGQWEDGEDVRKYLGGMGF